MRWCGPVGRSVCTPAPREQVTAAAFGGRVLDASAIAALATGSSVYARAMRQTAVAEGITLVVPAAAYAAAWTSSAPLGRMLLDGFLDLPVVVVDPLDARTARASAVVLARAGGRASLDLGQVIASAHGRGWPVITETPGPLLALAPDVAVEALP